MPLYEYECKECGVRFERRQPYQDKPLTVCPECNGTLRRVIGTTGVIFKGPGFYVNDHAKAGSKAKHAES